MVSMAPSSSPGGASPGGASPGGASPGGTSVAVVEPGDASAAVLGTGIPATSTPTALKAQTPWFKRRSVLYFAAIFVVVGVAGLVASLILFGTWGIAGTSGSTSSADGAAPSVPASQSSPAPSPAGQETALDSKPMATLAPSPMPSATPSLLPSATPSLRASNFPSEQPSFSPTFEPTAHMYDQFSFYVMGDIPYAKWEEEVLARQLANMTASRPQRSSFTVHVGDLMNADHSKCDRPYFEIAHDLLLQGPLPTFVLQGDNDSLDCVDQPEARRYFLRYFAGNPNLPSSKPFEQNWSGARLPDDAVELKPTRWTERRPELFSFVAEGILFLSICILNGNPRDEEKLLDLNNRMADSIEWVTRNVNRAFRKDPMIRGVVLFGHAERRPETRPFFEAILPLFFPTRLHVPVLYLHGDGHKFKIDTRFSVQTGWALFHDVQVDQGAQADPLLVEVAPLLHDGEASPLKVEQNESQYVFGNGLFRIDRQKGRYQ